MPTNAQNGQERREFHLIRRESVVSGNITRESSGRRRICRVLADPTGRRIGCKRHGQAFHQA